MPILSSVETQDDPLYEVSELARHTLTRQLQVQTKCLSNEGEVLKISAADFMKKVMSIPQVSWKINQNLEQKMHHFTYKSALRFQTIKVFNTEGRSRLVQEAHRLNRSMLVPDTSNEPDLAGDPRRLSKKKSSQLSAEDFNKMIIEQQKEKRCAINEIINDYPETKRLIMLELDAEQSGKAPKKRKLGSPVADLVEEAHVIEPLPQTLRRGTQSVL